jgi:hypothetical protein
MKRLLPLLALLLLSAAPAKPSLTITRDERAMLLGFQGRAEAIQLRAQRELQAVANEQTAYLGRVASRLGVPTEQLRTGYTINLDTLAVEPRPKATK